MYGGKTHSNSTRYEIILRMPGDYITNRDCLNQHRDYVINNQLHPRKTVGCNCISMPKCQW